MRESGLDSAFKARSRLKKRQNLRFYLLFSYYIRRCNVLHIVVLIYVSLERRTSGLEKQGRGGGDFGSK